MKILNDIRLLDTCIKMKDAIILGDVHIGYEEAINKTGTFIPRIYFEEMYSKMEKILKKEKPTKVIINGDLKHEFGRISDQEWRDTIKFINLIEKYSKKIILVEGNHDKIIEPIVKHKKVEIKKFVKLNDIFICHGNEIFEEEFKDIKTIIISHEHPAVTIRDKNRTETFKCFLKGKYKDKELIVLPSFNTITAGTDIVRQKT